MSLPPAPAHPRRLVFLGTPELAVPPLRALHAAGYELALVVSRPDKRRGRGGQLQPSPVKAAALELDLPVSDQVDDVLTVGADLGVVVAFGRIIKPHVLAELPMVNLHFSLLPRWRGAAPVERTILAGDQRTGVDLMVVEEGLDTGGIYAEAVLDVGPDETADELRSRLVEVGTRLLVDSLAQGLGAPRPQVGDPVYADKVEPSELEIDWLQDATTVHRLVRLGGAWTTFRGKRLKIWKTERVDGSSSTRTMAAPTTATSTPAPGALSGDLVGTGGGGALRLVEVQPEGKGRQAATAWRNGARPDAGEVLGG
jgi:methionyl-tRNA formyltransferase